MYNYKPINRHQGHVHEFLGSVCYADGHTHRFAGITGPAIPYQNSHIHEIDTRTDNTNHHHRIRAFTGPAINIGNGRHVHRATGETSFEDGHRHRYIFATLIERPN